MQDKAIAAPAATRNTEDRIAELDRQGVAEALNYPMLGSLVEHSAADDPQLQAAIIHALNVWLAEDWSYDYENRIFSTPIINLCEVDAAQRELSYILERGARVALIKPGPVNACSDGARPPWASSIRSGATSKPRGYRSSCTPATRLWMITSPSGSHRTRRTS
jgi:hypothetical protein